MYRKDVLIAWIDIQIFEKLKDDSIVEEIWEALNDEKLLAVVSKNTLNEIQELKAKGSPYISTMFSKAKEEIFESMQKEDYSLFIESCTLASIYSKRRWNTGLSLPEEAFNKIINECDVTGWKLKLESGDIKIHKKKIQYSNICYREECIVNVPINVLADLMFSKRAEYDKVLFSMNVLEKINQDTVIYHGITKSLVPLCKKRDFVIMLSKREKNGSIMILTSSCDHESAPETDKYVRMKLNLVGNILTPLSSTTTLCIGVNQVLDTGKLLGTVKQGKMMIDRCLKRCKQLKEYTETLQEPVAKKRRNSHQNAGISN